MMFNLQKEIGEIEIILKHHGTFKLTIPVLTKGNFYQSINETKTNGSDWAAKH